MAASSADDHLTVGGDANVLDSAETYQALRTSLHDAARRLLLKRTQWHALSAPINNPTGAGAQGGTQDMLGTFDDDGVVIVEHKLGGKCSSRRTSSRRSHVSRVVPT